MNAIVERALRDVERRISQAVNEERRERMTQSMALLAEWGFSNARIVQALELVFGERFTEGAVKMRVRAWRKAREASGQ